MEASGAPAQANVNYQYCDLVMKGGITSGVIYPAAVVGLAAQYRFKNIGGTSAGAIAAAVTAAAELGRRTNNSAALQTLENLPKELAANGHLLELFTPDHRTRKVFKLLLGFTQNRGTPGKIVFSLFGVALSAPLVFLIVLIAGLLSPAVLYTLARWHSLEPFAGLLCRHPIVCGLTGMAVGLPLALSLASVQGAIQAVRALAANGFGLCSGCASAKGPEESLTGWIHGRIQAAAGRPLNRPVTFGDLWNAPAYPGETLVTDRTIHFEVVTTGITEGRPFTIPFREGALYFDTEEFGALFPPDVFSAILAASSKAERGEAENPARTLRDNRPVASPSKPSTVLRRFPEAEDLPIVVATRMSLSFPGLVSAIPLYRIDFSLARNQKGKTQLETRVGTKVWFSDGGICSNFPLSFFDSALPRWPTFGINLQQLGETACAGDRSKAAQFVTPPRPVGASPVIWNSIGDARWTPNGTVEQRDPFQCVVKFGGAIVNTMQNWGDSLQASAPGFRDRIVSVGLCRDEGGLNLAMPPALITDLSARGAEAARLLIGKFDFQQHLFTRFRVTICGIQDYLQSLRTAVDGRSLQNDLGWQYIEDVQKPPHYPWSHSHIAERAPQALHDLVAMLTAWQGSLHEKDGFCTDAPRPEVKLRSTLDF